MTIRVLIADDSAFLRKKISEILKSNKKIQVIGTAKNGKEAIKKVGRQNPDVILLDLMMPKVSGLEAFRRIMKDNPTPTIILSSISPQTLDSSVQALLLGAFDYIIKPGTMGSKKRSEFQKHLIDKILLASTSRFKKIYARNEKVAESKDKIPFRQRWVNEVFQFGEYLKNLESPKEENITKSEEDTFIEKKSKSQVSPNKNVKVLKKEEQQKKGKKRTQKTLLDKGETKTLQKKEKLMSRQIKTQEKPKVTSKSKMKEVLEEKEEREKKGGGKSNIQTSQEFELTKTLSKERLQKRIKSKKPIYRSKSGRKIRRIESKLVVIGASVGGPKALRTILQELPNNFPFPIIIVQHLNNHFINPLAESLDNSCEIKVKVAKNNETLKPSTVYIAPGEKHIKIGMRDDKPCLITYSGEPVNSCLPSVDILFSSASDIYENSVIGILLTGMGEDGVNGLAKIHKKGGITITESEETAILFGMPKFAIEKGVVDKVLPNYKINDFLIYKAYY